MNIKKIAMSLAASLLMLVLSPPQLVNLASAETVVVDSCFTQVGAINYSAYCSDCNYAIQQITTPDNKHYWRMADSAKMCSHGSYNPHYYNPSTGECSGRVTGVDYSTAVPIREGQPSLSAVPYYTFDPILAAAPLRKYAQNVSVSYTGNLYQGSYYIYGKSYTLSIKSSSHIPITVENSSLLYDAYNMNTSVPVGSSLYTIGTLSGDVTLYLGLGRLQHRTTLCPNSQPVLTGSHKNAHEVSSWSENYNDGNGNIIGGAGGAKFECSACGAAWTVSGGGLTTPGYSGSIYNSDGDLVGGISSSSGTTSSWGVGLMLERGDFNYSAGSSLVRKNPCYTATYPVCTKHDNAVGAHFYCERHNYYGLSTLCPFDDRGNLLYKDARVYQFYDQKDETRVYSCNLSCARGTLVYANYASTVPGGHITLTNATNSDAKYTVIANSKTVASGVLTSSATFDMPSADVVVYVEPVKLAQNVSVLTSYTMHYNNQTFDLQAVVF